MTLKPAYGRDYKSQKEVQADFDADKDFIIADVFSPYSGKPVNKSQIVSLEGMTRTITIRYAKLRKVMVVIIREPEV